MGIKQNSHKAEPPSKVTTLPTTPAAPPPSAQLAATTNDLFRQDLATFGTHVADVIDSWLTKMEK